MRTFQEVSQGGGCPCCGESIHLHWGNIEIDADKADQAADCYTCGFRWFAIYAFEGFEYKTYQDEIVFVGADGEEITQGG